jgi:hypothetical protein
MVILFYLFVLLALLFTAFIGYLIMIIKKNDWDSSLNILNMFVKIGLILFISSQLIISFISLFYIDDSLLIFLVVFKQIITTTFFIFIYFKTVELLDNLNKGSIFANSNAILTREIGLYFLYLSMTEIIAGFILGIITFSSTGSFNIASNATIYIYIIVALVLQIISKILQKAIDIYEENQLTI